ncbi:ABC transporter permease subunit [Ruminococcus sp.]|uniref:ABC transporter permease subunit n=1 Tax=Ruminococcus sp. TaxID=41978 RepID=UPI0025DE1D4F|nr:ABC transporter permease subunit [Ruminococcus sp.]MBQ8967788.1 ABC transporter permease subunit [Ruminococcus sp.]
MYNVIKAQCYQLLHSLSTYVVAVLGILFMILMCAIDDFDSNSMCGGYFAMMTNEAVSSALSMIVMVYTAFICAGDMKDKTINYEVLTGTGRSAVYFGRIITAVVVSIICHILFLVVPPMIVTAIYGWGGTIPVSDFVLRIVSALFPLLRLTMLYAFLSFIFKSSALVCAAGYVLTFLEVILSVMLQEFFPDTVVPMYVFSLNAITKLLVPANYGFGFEDGKDITVVKDLLQTSTAVHGMAAGLLGCVVFGILGCTVFKKKDMG